MEAQYGPPTHPALSSSPSKEAPVFEKKKKKKKKKDGKNKPEQTKKLTEEELDAKIGELLEEYLNSNDIQEAIHCIKDLHTPHIGNKIVEKGVVITLDKQEKDRELMSKLFTALSNEDLVTEEEFMKG